MKMLLKNALGFAHFQHSDQSFKLWVRKSEDTTAFCSYCQRKIDVTEDEENTLNEHAGLAAFEDKAKPQVKNHFYR